MARYRGIDLRFYAPTLSGSARAALGRLPEGVRPRVDRQQDGRGRENHDDGGKRVGESDAREEFDDGERRRRDGRSR